MNPPPAPSPLPPPFPLPPPPPLAFRPVSTSLSTTQVVSWAVHTFCKIVCAPFAGPTLRFHTDLLVAITGAAFQATLDGKAVPLWQSFKAPKGSQLAIGKVEGEAGCRGYIAVGGGVDVPLYLGSRSTFPGGKLGGLQVGCLITQRGRMA